MQVWGELLAILGSLVSAIASHRHPSKLKLNRQELRLLE